MSITAECNSCGRRYQAPASMAGKVVRCKQCGNVFEVPNLQGTPDLDALADMERSVHSIDATMSSTGTGVHDDSAAGDDAEYEDPGPLSRGRTNVRFSHAYAKEIDQYLPPVLAIGGIAWLALETFRRDETGQPWVSVVRVLVALVAYSLFIAPLTLVMIRAAGKKLGYQMPRNDRWRAFAGYLPAFVLGLIMWVAGEGSVLGLVLGALVGIMVSTGALWLLFRLKPHEIAPSATYALIGFFLGLTVAGGIFFGANALLVNILVATKHPDAVPASPIAQGMPWISPELQQTLIAQKTGTKRANPPTPAKSSQAEQAPAASPGSGSGSNNQQPQSTQASNTSTTNPRQPQPANTTPEPPKPDVNTQQASSDLPQINSPIIKSIDLAPIKGQFDGVIRPLTESPYIATAVHGNNDSTIIELWDTDTWDKKGTATFANAQQMGGVFVLSPDGEHLARIANFPRLSAQVWSFSENRVSKILNLDSNLGQPELIGFAGDRKLLIRWEPDMLEVVDITGATKAKQIATPSFERRGNTLTVNRDGTLAAIATKVENQPTVIIYNLDTGSIVGRSKITALDPRWPVTPTGMAFSPDSSKIALMFEQDGNGLIVCYKTAPNATGNAQALAEHVYPAGPLPGHDIRKYSGSALAWLPNGKGWLVYGQGVFDMSTGQMVADLAMPCIEATRVVPPDIIEVVAERPQDSSQKQITLLRLDMQKVASLMQNQQPDIGRP